MSTTIRAAAIMADYGNAQAGGNATLDLKLETSGTASGQPWVGVSGAGTFAQATVAGSQVLGIQSDAFNTHVRVVATVGGSARYPVSVNGGGSRPSKFWCPHVRPVQERLELGQRRAFTRSTCAVGLGG